MKNILFKHCLRSIGCNAELAKVLLRNRSRCLFRCLNFITICYNSISAFFTAKKYLTFSVTLFGVNTLTFTKPALFILQLILLQNIFDTLIDSYIENKVGIAEGFLNKVLLAHLKENLQLLHTGNQLQRAGTGKNENFEQNKLFRNDIIYWLDRKHNNIHENSFFDLMDAFIVYLNATCYTGITAYEFHYTLYETGSFYKTHLDQFQNNDSRKYSIILYLNTEWETADGGELCIHHAAHLQNIAPTNGRIVFFKSNELPHEVLVTNKPRMSITGWLKA